MARRRANAYAELFRESLSFARLTREFSLGVDVGDIPNPLGGMPIFAFQRTRGQRVLLLPDVDLLFMQFLEGSQWDDGVNFFQKSNGAIFVGATTGGEITMAVARSLELPRLRAAAAFKESRAVTFLLPEIVQYDSQETADAVRALGFGDKRVEWKDQLAFRHLISMDGNGATCSRVAIALKSNSVLLKYTSNQELFYFQFLRPWRHYVPIADDAAVEAAVAHCGTHPLLYARIANSGKRFFRSHLSRFACTRYTAALLRGYSNLIDQAEGQRSTQDCT